jgi:hypothetical protein
MLKVSVRSWSYIAHLLDKYGTGMIWCHFEPPTKIFSHTSHEDGTFESDRTSFLPSQRLVLSAQLQVCCLRLLTQLKLASKIKLLGVAEPVRYKFEEMGAQMLKIPHISETVGRFYAR